MNKPIPFKVLIPTKRKVVEKLMNGNANLITWYFEAIDGMLYSVKVWQEEMPSWKVDYRSEIWQMEYVLSTIGSKMNDAYQMDKTALKDASREIMAKYVTEKSFVSLSLEYDLGTKYPPKLAKEILKKRPEQMVERAEDAIEKRKQKHVLYSGQLWDMPGRMETWTEYVLYLGGNKWVLSVEGTDFSGRNPGDKSEEIKDTDKLISWVHGRDYENRDEESDDDEPSVAQLSTSEESGPEKRVLGPRASRLRKIALDVGARDCVKILDDWASGLA